MKLHNSAPLLILIVASIGTSTLIMNSSSNTAAAISKASGGASTGPVVQEQVNTGNLALDKEINKFYSCISKTHQDPPTVQIVDNCYYQTSTGGLRSGSNNTPLTNHDNHFIGSHSARGIGSPPPGVLVEVQ